ncbi:helix-turn-helix domain-containing protein [Sphingobacterium faecale]|uniref:Helix-turn-helix transcriptional regulator n=1 Tax=Sphingobacterium faecale TaxID=2803775 RepID=A0ABS1R082_9SPHI|nr:AraC family transcriptional regulator [Sphingobacterium faecale]MBL1408103.1 helix-turn-helix transcriptional regulator [Sphingobacterium faecale]
MVIICLYTTIFVVALQALLVYRSIKERNYIDHILAAFLLQMTVDISLMFLFTEVFSGMEYVSTAAPFGLTFGPFLFWIYRILEDRRVVAKQIFLHFIPFLIGAVAYITFLCSPVLRTDYAVAYYISLYSAMCLSWASYPIFVLISSQKNAKLNLGVFKYAMIVLLVLTSFMLPYVWTTYNEGVKEEPLMTGIIVIGAMLSGVSLIYWYMLGRYRGGVSVLSVGTLSMSKEEQREIDLLEEVIVKQPNNVVLAHKDKIDNYLRQEKYFDVDFKLEQMAQELNIAKSVISQYFTQVYSDGFVKTINAWRIEKACEMLASDELSIGMEDLAFSCGFNSRASFYRNFNLEKGCSPTVYRERVFSGIS